MKPTAWLCLAFAFAITLATAADAPAGPTVGMEGRIEITLEGPRLEARPVSDRSAVILRIADTDPHGTLTRYDLRFTGLRPGAYDLRDFLITPDGSKPTNLPPIPVQIAGLLPARHDGRLLASPRQPVPAVGGYRTALITISAAWIVGLVAWLWMQRRGRRVETPLEATAEPTLEDRLRPLVESGTRGELTAEGQAQLERLLLGHWRHRLGWESLPMDEALVRLREHPEAGILLRDLEGWLHRPKGTVAVDVATLLAPYRRAAAGAAPVVPP